MKHASCWKIITQPDDMHICNILNNDEDLALSQEPFWVTLFSLNIFWYLSDMYILANLKMVMKIALPQGPSFNLHLFHYFVFVFVSIREQIRNTRDGDEDSSASRALIQPQSFPLKVIPEREKACRNKILAFSTFFWQHPSFNLKRNKILAFSRFPF